MSGVSGASGPIGSQLVNTWVACPTPGDLLLWDGVYWRNTSSCRNDSLPTNGNFDIITTTNNIVNGTVTLLPTNLSTTYRQNATNISSTGVWTVQADGWYLVTMNVSGVANAGVLQNILLTITSSVTGNTSYGANCAQVGATGVYDGMEDNPIPLYAGDTVIFRVTASGTQTSFWAHLSGTYIAALGNPGDFAFESQNNVWTGAGTNTNPIIPASPLLAGPVNILSPYLNKTTGKYTFVDQGTNNYLLWVGASGTGAAGGNKLNYAYGVWSNSFDISFPGSTLAGATAVPNPNGPNGYLGIGAQLFHATAGDSITFSATYTNAQTTTTTAAAIVKLPDYPSVNADFMVQYATTSFVNGWNQIKVAGLDPAYDNIVPANMSSSGVYTVSIAGVYLVSFSPDINTDGVENPVTQFQIWKTDAFGANVVIAQEMSINLGAGFPNSYDGSIVVVTTCALGDTLTFQVNAPNAQTSQNTAIGVSLLVPNWAGTVFAGLLTQPPQTTYSASWNQQPVVPTGVLTTVLANNLSTPPTFVNTGNLLNTATGLYTAPIGGMYSASMNAYVGAVTNAVETRINLNGGQFCITAMPAGGALEAVPISCNSFHMNQGDTVSFQILQSSGASQTFNAVCSVCYIGAT